MMRISGLCLAVLLLSLHSASAQTTPAVRDPQAITVLTEAVNAAGGMSAIASVQDFTGTGNITYYWAGQEVTGSATVRGLGSSLFRLDAELPDGTRSWAVTDTKGTLKNPDGTTSQIQYSNAISLGGLTLPYLRIAAALSNPNFSITPAGTATLNGRNGTVIQIQEGFPASEDPTGDLARLNAKRYVIDPQTLAVVETKDTLFSEDGRMLPVAHEMIFSNVTTVNGVAVPLSVVEKVGGQKTWSLQLGSVTFNSGLETSIFQF